MVNGKRLDDLVNALKPTDDLYQAALDIAATLHDGTQAPERLLAQVIGKMNEWMEQPKQRQQDKETNNANGAQKTTKPKPPFSGIA